MAWPSRSLEVNIKRIPSRRPRKKKSLSRQTKNTSYCEKSQSLQKTIFLGGQNHPKVNKTRGKTTHLPRTWWTNQEGSFGDLRSQLGIPAMPQREKKKQENGHPWGKKKLKIRGEGILLSFGRSFWVLLLVLRLLVVCLYSWINPLTSKTKQNSFKSFAYQKTWLLYPKIENPYKFKNKKHKRSPPSPFPQPLSFPPFVPFVPKNRPGSVLQEIHDLNQLGLGAIAA